MSATLASAITRSASRQTYLTIRLLVDRPMVDDAYRAYAYFRWLDDLLDAASSSGAEWDEAERIERRQILDRQRTLLDRSLRGESPRPTCPQEAMLAELIRNTVPWDADLDAYLSQMMLVMDFDVRRRGRIVTEAELNAYTRCLAVAVTGAMRHFIGHGAYAPEDETRYMAVAGAHILHMLRDTYADLRAGYFNVPREMLEAHSIGPRAVNCDAYRAWVEERVHLAGTSTPAPRTSRASRTGGTGWPASPTSPASSGSSRRSSGMASGCVSSTTMR
jgi:phytoene/squalene synthetase